LTGLSIQAAIKKLSPPKPVSAEQPATKITTIPKPSDKGTHATRHDIVAAWMATASTEHAKAIDAIGLEPLLAAIPDAWWPLIEQRVADRGRARATMPTPTYLIPDDLSVPEFLHRALPAEREGETVPPPEVLSEPVVTGGAPQATVHHPGAP
jgi:hypothetical protein